MSFTPIIYTIMLAVDLRTFYISNLPCWPCIASAYVLLPCVGFLNNTYRPMLPTSSLSPFTAFLTFYFPCGCFPHYYCFSVRFISHYTASLACPYDLYNVSATFYYHVNPLFPLRTFSTLLVHQRTFYLTLHCFLDLFLPYLNHLCHLSLPSRPSISSAYVFLLAFSTLYFPCVCFPHY